MECFETQLWSLPRPLLFDVFHFAFIARHLAYGILAMPN